MRPLARAFATASSAQRAASRQSATDPALPGEPTHFLEDSHRLGIAPASHQGETQVPQGECRARGIIYRAARLEHLTGALDRLREPPKEIEDQSRHVERCRQR